MLPIKKNCFIIIFIVFIIIGSLLKNFFDKIGFVDSYMVKFQVLELYVRKNIFMDFYWYNEIPKNHFIFSDDCFECRVDYLSAIVYIFGESIEKSGEGTLVFYHSIDDNERCKLYKKLKYLDNSKYYLSLNNEKKYGVDFLKNIIIIDGDNNCDTIK